MHERRQRKIGMRLAPQSLMERSRAASIAALIAAGSVALVLCAPACAPPEPRLGAKPVSATPQPGWDPSSLRLYVDEHGPPLCSTPVPQPAFYVRSAQMRPEDTVAVAELGRCLASPDFLSVRVQLVGAPDRTATATAAGHRDGETLALQRAARVAVMLADSGVAAQRISISTALDRPDLDGRVAVDLYH
jgi:hypothetical protein